MPVIKRTVVDRIEPGNPIGIRLQKQFYDTDADKVVSFEYHRTVVEDGASVAEQMAAVNENLVRDYGFPAVDTAAVLAAIAAAE
jgi:hypothetical protein